MSTITFYKAILKLFLLCSLSFFIHSSATAQTWQYMGPNEKNFIQGEHAFCYFKDALYVAHTSDTSHVVRIEKWQDNHWIEMARFENELCYSNNFKFIEDGLGNLYLFYRVDYGEHTLGIKKLQGNTWTSLVETGFPVQHIVDYDVEVNASGAIFLSYSVFIDGIMNFWVKKLSGNQFTDLGDLSFIPENSRYFHLFLNLAGNPVFAHKSLADDSLHVVHFNGQKWMPVCTLVELANGLHINFEKSGAMNLITDYSILKVFRYENKAITQLPVATLNGSVQSKQFLKDRTGSEFLLIHNLEQSTGTYKVRLKQLMNDHWVNLDTTFFVDPPHIALLKYAYDSKNNLYIAAGAHHIDVRKRVGWQWLNATTASLCDSFNHPIIKFGPDNQPVLATFNSNNQKTEVQFKNGGTWVKEEVPVRGILIQLELNSYSQPILLLRNSDTLIVQKRIAKNNWQQLMRYSSTANETLFNARMFVGPKDTTYIALMSNDFPKSTIRVLKLKGAVWEQVGPGYSEAQGLHEMAFAVSPTGKPYIATSLLPNYQLVTKELNNYKWQDFGGALHDQILDYKMYLDRKGNPYLSYRSGSFNFVYSTIKSGIWYPVFSLMPKAGPPSFEALAFDQRNDPYVVYSDPDKFGKLSVVQAQDRASYVGISGVSIFNALRGSIAFDKLNGIYISYFSAGTFVQRFQLPCPTIQLASTVSPRTFCEGLFGEVSCDLEGQCLSYEWQKEVNGKFQSILNNAGMHGINAPVLWFNRFERAMAGNYRCVVKDTCCSDSLLTPTFAFLVDPAIRPAVGATNIVIKNKTSSSFDVSWTKGSGAQRLVLVREGKSPNPSKLTSNIDYVPQADFSRAFMAQDSSYVVYNGSAPDQVTVTGIDPNKNYFVALVEYNFGKACQGPVFRAVEHTEIISTSPLAGVDEISTTWPDFKLEENRLSGIHVSKLTVYDLLGRLLLESNGEQLLLPEGIFMVQVHAGNKRKVAKVIIRSNY